MTLNRDSFEYIQRLLRRRAAIVIEPNKSYLVQARLQPVARRHGLTTIDQLVTELRGSHVDALIDDVVDAMTTNETFFFRDAAPFAALRREVFPQLFLRRAQQRRVRIWSAACSTGQEPFSIAMLLCEHFPQYRDWDIRMLATDLSHTVLQQAKTGSYNEMEMSRGLSPALRDKYFHRHGSNWTICDEIRSMVEFRPLNLAVQWPDLPKMDIILLRNVMVYFEAATKKTILRRIRKLLWQDGYLFLGGAETTLNLDDAFTRIVIDDFSFFQLHDDGVDRPVRSFLSSK